MSATLNSRIPEVKRRMHLSSEVLIHRAANRQVAEYQQTAPRDTGLMADTTHTEPEEPTGRDSSHYRVDAVSPQEYAPPVEFGTVKMEARPRFLPAYENSKRQLQVEAKAVTETVLKGGVIPIATVGVRRSITQAHSPTVGAIRKVR